jgi:hypothetical protein
MKFTEEKEKELKMIDIPRISNHDFFEKNREKADDLGFDHCPCCGRPIPNPKFFFNSAFGGSAYLSSDRNEYDDCWVMGVGPECMKKFPKGYIFEK